MLTWQDRFLTLQLVAALLALSVVLALLGFLSSLLPWGLIWEWLFRILGLAAFGPHMWWVGKKVEEARAQAEAEEEAFKFASNEERDRILDEKRDEMLAEARRNDDCSRRGAPTTLLFTG